jgi:hypothetical protein
MGSIDIDLSNWHPHSSLDYLRTQEYTLVVKSQETLLESFQYLSSNSSAKLIIHFKSDTSASRKCQ